MGIIKTIIRRVIISAIREGQIKRFDADGLNADEFIDREHFQHYGFTSRPQPNAEGIVIGIGNVFYMIAEDDRTCRIAIENGEVAIYTDEGDKVHLKRGNVIEIHSAGEVNITAANSVSIDGGTQNVKGVVQGDCICSYTGSPHPMTSTNVKASL